MNQDESTQTGFENFEPNGQNVITQVCENGQYSEFDITELNSRYNDRFTFKR